MVVGAPSIPLLVGRRTLQRMSTCSDVSRDGVAILGSLEQQFKDLVHIARFYIRMLQIAPVHTIDFTPHSNHLPSTRLLNSQQSVFVLIHELERNHRASGVP